MNEYLASTVIHLADIQDPTSDGILIKVVNYGLGALMVIVALVGGWYAFQAWTGAKGKKAGLTEMRDVVFGVLVLEAILGGIIIIANYGSTILSGFAG